MHNFDVDEGQRKIGKHVKKRTTSAQEQNGQRIKTDTCRGQALIPSINNTNLSNSKQGISTQKINSEKCESGSSVILGEASRSEESLSVKFKTPSISEVRLYFAEKDAPPEEAEKFFNHYESNGWLVGGKAKMKNWQAAARNWLLNSKKFNPQSSAPVPKTTHLHATTTKSYQEKL